jgi:hypothetical protein
MILAKDERDDRMPAVLIPVQLTTEGTRDEVGH